MSDIFNGINFNVPGPEDVPIARGIFRYAKKASRKIQEGIESFLPGIGAARESVRRHSFEPEKLFLKQNVQKLARARTFEELAPTVLGFTGELQAIKGAIGPTSQIAEEADSALSKLIAAIKKAKPVRGEISILQSAERSRRIGAASGILEKGQGEGAFIQAKGALKGPLIPENPRFEPIRTAGGEKLSPKDISTLADQINHYPTFTTFEKISTYDGFTKLLNGEIPQPKKLEYLEDVFGKDLVDSALKHRTGMEKVTDTFKQSINLMRSVMASFDLSFGGRQGIFAAPRFRKEFADAWVKQFKMFGSEQAYREIMDGIAADPNYLFAKESGVSFTNLGSQIAGREEKFASQWGDYIPGVKQSSRAYTGFANKFRMDIFNSLARDAAALGKPLRQNKEMAQETARFINMITGRGSLGKLERAAPVLNGLFFSPRLMASRINLLNPLTYIKASPFVRKQMLTSLIGFAGYVTTTLTLAKLAGLSAGTDMRSSDFGKIRVGNTRFDIMGGFQQYIRMFAQLVTGQYVSSVTGKTLTLGEGYKPLTRFDILLRQVESKEAPIFSFITDLLRQQDYAGKPVNITKEIVSRFTPMVFGDLYEIAKQNPKLLPWGLLGIFGVGIQTYKRPQRSIFQ